MAHEQDLDLLEFRTPITQLQRKDGTKLDFTLHDVWQRRLKSLWAFVSRHRRIIAVSTSQTLIPANSYAVHLCTGTITLTLPTTSEVGHSYYIFNYGVGVITIA